MIAKNIVYNLITKIKSLFKFIKMNGRLRSPLTLKGANARRVALGAEGIKIICK